MEGRGHIFAFALEWKKEMPSPDLKRNRHEMMKRYIPSAKRFKKVSIIIHKHSSICNGIKPRRYDCALPDAYHQNIVEVNNSVHMGI